MSRPSSRLRFGTAAGSALVTAGAWLLASACGPGVATPMPEPPSAFDLSGVYHPELGPINTPEDPRVLVLPGAAGTVPAGALVRVTNLDSTEQVATTSAAADGSFDALVVVADGQELRFEWVDGDRRSAPADALVSRPAPTGQAFTLTEAARFACVELQPGWVLAFGSSTTATLRVKNACTTELTLDNARTRLGLADFVLPATLPPSVAAGEAADIEVTFSRSANGPREDVLFLDLTLDGSTIRYPITLRAE